MIKHIEFVLILTLCMAALTWSAWIGIEKNLCARPLSTADKEAMRLDC